MGKLSEVVAESERPGFVGATLNRRLPYIADSGEVMDREGVMLVESYSRAQLEAPVGKIAFSILHFQRTCRGGLVNHLDFV